MTTYNDFVTQADILAHKIQNNGDRAKNIKEKIEKHSRLTSRLSTVKRYAQMFRTMFRERFLEKTHGK